jgi:hypothetical protein
LRTALPVTIAALAITMIAMALHCCFNESAGLDRGSMPPARAKAEGLYGLKRAAQLSQWPVAPEFDGDHANAVMA